MRATPDGGLEGMDVDILRALAGRHGLEYDFHEAGGYVLMMQEVQNGTSDVAMSQGSYNFDRYNVAGDISVYEGTRNFHIKTRRPGVMAPMWCVCGGGGNFWALLIFCPTCTPTFFCRAICGTSQPILLVSLGAH